MRIAHLKLKNWKNFMEADLALQDRVFVVGPNAGGKSNLLDALRFLHELVMPGGGLIQAVRLRGGLEGILPFAFSKDESKKAEVSLAIRLKEADGVFWDYALAFKSSDSEVPYPTVARESVTYTNGETVRVLLERPSMRDLDDPESLSQTYLEQVAQNKEFRTVVSFLQAIRGTRISPFGVHSDMENIHPSILGAEQRPVALELLASIARVPAVQRAERLEQLTKTMQNLVPDLDRIEWHPSVKYRTCLRIHRKSWSETAYADETKLSDGTLRLFAFFWYLQDTGGALILEEPECSIPPGVLQVLVPFAHEAQKNNGCRQIIVSTHSPHLLGDPGIAAEEVVIIRPLGSNGGCDGGASVALASDDPMLSEVIQVGLSAAEAIFPIIDDPSAGLELLRTRL